MKIGRSVPFVDLSAQYSGVREEIMAAIGAVLESQQCVLGPVVERFERSFAAHVGAPFAVGVSSGTDALLCALQALGVGPGDEVITTPFSFIATVEGIVRLGATPRFADIDPGTLNLDPMGLRAAIGPNTRAVMPVHLFGLPAAMEDIVSIAEAAGVAVIEDAAQAFGARRQGRHAGTWGTLGCFSFYPSKPLGGAGDGGMIVTSDPELAERCRLLRNHGTRDKREHSLVGGNFRLDGLQAAVLEVKLRHAEAWRQARGRHAAAYTEALAGVPGLVPPVAAVNSAWANYTIRVPEALRTTALRALLEAGIDARVFYERPLYRQPCFASLNMAPSDFPHTERACGEVLSLPLYAEMRDEQRDHVVAVLRQLLCTSVRSEKKSRPEQRGI